MNPTTYDLATLHAQVKDTVPHRAAFCVELEVWDHRHAEGDLSVEVCISVIPPGEGRVQQFRGPTPEVALAALRAHYATRDLQPEDLGVVTVPEGRPVVEYGGVDNDG